MCLDDREILTHNGSEIYVGGTSSTIVVTLDISFSRLKQTICMTCSCHDVEVGSISISYIFVETDRLCKFLRTQAQRLQLSVAS